MNTYEQIVNNSKKGLYTVIQYKEGNYKIVSPLKDGVGDFISTYRGSSIDECKTKGFNSYVFKKEIEDTKIIETYHLPVEPFNVGDKVRILDSVKEIDDWENYKEEYPDMTGEITEVFNKVNGLYYTVKGEDIWRIWGINHRYLAPLYNDDENEDTVEIDGKEFSKSTIKEALKEYIK